MVYNDSMWKEAIKYVKILANFSLFRWTYIQGNLRENREHKIFANKFHVNA